MQSQKAASQARSGKGHNSRPPNGHRVDRSLGPAAAGGSVLLQSKYRELIRHHLGKLLDKLFAEFTGLHFHVSWAPAPPHEWDTQTLPTDCSVCCRLSGSPLLPDCRTCGPTQLARALRRDGDGHRFTCRLGVRNHWFPIRVRGETLGIAYLQALDRRAGKPPDRRRSARVEAKVLGRARFARAARFLQLIVQHAQTASLSDLRKAELTSAGRAVLALENEQARLHETLQRHLPPQPQSPCQFGPKPHAEQVVNRLLDCIEQNYGKPITLQQCADTLGMNPAYLSDLFSHSVGVPFKAYLTALRLQKAKALLGDPLKTVSDVACSTGYASENRFRIAFKKATGLPPRIWRETLRMAQPALGR